jgi:hypothetical protein
MSWQARCDVALQQMQFFGTGTQPIDDGSELKAGIT